jgi:glycerol-3-phosphate acyltransferase PlsX
LTHDSRPAIALDAMGGDHAPEQIVLGALAVAPELKCRILLVGDEEKLQKLLPTSLPNGMEVVHATQCVEMDEKPVEAYRAKKDSSLMVAAQLVKNGKAAAMVSAGNTGAATAFSLLQWRTLPGIHRPAIASRLPNRDGGFLLLDSGASPDVDPEHLAEFALMGRAYAEIALGRKNPRVHLLNIGEEDGKGNAFTQKAFQTLKAYPWFAGNIESKDMYSKPCDVVLCDAFVGNVVLKASEGVAELIRTVISEAVPKNPVMRSLYWPVRKVTAPLRKEMDYAASGGAPLLGLNGVCIICHGRSNQRAIKNALVATEKLIEQDLVGMIRTAIDANIAES